MEGKFGPNSKFDEQVLNECMGLIVATSHAANVVKALENSITKLNKFVRVVDFQIKWIDGPNERSLV